MSIEFTITGDDKVIRGLDEYEDVLSDYLQAGLQEAGEFLLEKSQEIVPVDTGALHDSGYVVVSGSGFGSEVAVGYSMEYAVYVHEDLRARHNPGTSAKYLEKPMRQYSANLQRIIADSIGGMDALKQFRSNN